MGTGTAIAIGVVVVVISIRTAATTYTVLPATNSAADVRARCHPCVVAALPLPPSGASDPTAAAKTKTLDGTATVTATATVVTVTTTAATATVMATATEEEECDGCDDADPRRRLDDSLLRIAMTTAPRHGGCGVQQPRRRRCL